MSLERIIIYIRHGEDMRDGYKYDERLTKYGKKAVKKLNIELIDEHGFPDVIHYSPYYRTRQTKRIMLKVINEILNEELPSTNCDFRLSRFFTKSQICQPSSESIENNLNTILPWMRLLSTGPKTLESELPSLLSPITQY